ncbi:twin-arginine translocation signal domain-containing protein [Streptomyces sp. NPDC047453]|uniref:twin-arginine translocation signal domain-containing protein n=1 Tax=Streptomyces sp. NPDC047453 TaxID=3154812 RepID=UPI0034053B18
MSRRSLLGYSGTTAAGAVLGGAAAAQPAPAQAAEPQAVQAQAKTASADFPVGTLFEGRVDKSTGAETPASLQIKFSVRTEETPAQAPYDISPQEIADLLNELAARKGWPTITFYGTPAPARLN